MAEDNHNLINRAVGHFNCGEYSEASRLAGQVAAENPNNAVAAYLLGMIAKKADQFDLAAKFLNLAILNQPNQPHYHFNLGDVRTRQQQWQAAENHYQTAINLKPDFADAHLHLGNLRMQQGDRKGAIACYAATVRHNPDHHNGLYNLGILSQEMGDHQAAIHFFKQALEIKPNADKIHTAQAFSLLMTGQFQPGWVAYEHRWGLEKLRPRICPVPRWDGASPRGKRLYVYSEQGFGDALMFVRYAPLITARGGEVILECRSELFSLFAASHLASKVVARRFGDGRPPEFAYDLHIPLLSLPGLFETTLETIPAAIPYLKPDPAVVEKWCQRLGPRRGVRVGIAWSGNPNSPANHHRACTLKDLLPITLVPGVSFFSAQKGIPAQELATMAIDHGIVNLDPELTDFSETAGLLANLDLLISTDTAVVHLAGGMGIPTWTLLHTASEWRWMRDRENSPWYPSLILFRQEQSGIWTNVVDRIRKALARLVADHTDLAKR